MVSNFQERLRMVHQVDKRPNEFFFTPGSDPFPFQDEPSGSRWGRSHLNWLHIDYESDCDLRQMLTKKSELNESSTILRFIQDELDLPWDSVVSVSARHETGSLYDRLRTLASPGKTTVVYKASSVPPSSSPAGSQESDASTLLYSTHGLSHHKTVAAPPTSRSSPSGSPKFPSVPSAPKTSLRRSTRLSGQPPPTYVDTFSQDSDPLLPSEDPAYQPPPSSPPAFPTDELDGAKPDRKLEKDVEFAAIAFLDILIDAFKSTETDLTETEKEEQDLKFEALTPPRLEIEIDGYLMTSAPDVGIQLFAKDTRVDLVVEVKLLSYSRADKEILAQEVSEMLGATLKLRRVWKQDDYSVLRMKVTNEYLSMLGGESSRLGECSPLIVQRSTVFNLKDPEQRVQFGIMAARVGIELLYRYEIHRGRSTGLIRRLRGETPFKLTEEDDAAVG